MNVACTHTHFAKYFTSVEKNQSYPNGYLRYNNRHEISPIPYIGINECQSLNSSLGRLSATSK